MKAIFRNFLLTLRRFRLASALNILGLSVAFATFIIIMIQVRYERTFDTAYGKPGRIFRIESTLVQTEANRSSHQSYTPFCARLLIEMILSSVPQIVSYTVMHAAPSEMYVKYENGVGEKTGMFMPFRRVSESLPDMFGMEMIEGNAACLSEPDKALLSESLARQMFGQASAIDRQMIRPDGTFFTVGGVYRDFPDNTSLVNDAKISLMDDFLNDWTNWTLFHYIVLAQDASAAEAEGQMMDFFNSTGMGKQMGFTDSVSFRLNPIEDIYYRHDTSLDIAPKGNRTTTNILLSIALLVVVIAAVNFLNFSTALTPSRIQSIHIRRILGESTVRLRFALVFESLGICLLSFLLALCWVLFFDLGGLSSILLASVSLAGNGEVVWQAFLLTVAVGLLSGIYPAFYMTSFRPVLILKGSFGMGKGGRKMRLLLTAFQFVISTGLIIAALFIWLQNRYMHTVDSMMNDSRIATVALDEEMYKQVDVLGEILRSEAFVTDVSFSDWPIGFQDYYLYTFTWSPENEDIMYYFLPVSYNFPSMMGLQIVEGRDFEKTDEAAGEERVILNELAARQFHVKTGDRLSNGQVVIGIVKDFHFMNLRKKIEPVALTVKISPNNIQQPSLYIRTAGNVQQAVENIKASIAQVDPLYPADVRFYDQQFEATYSKERKTSAQITLFSLLAVIISLMGVFGLVTFETQYRRKEIGVRKILGATTSEILYMFNRKFAWIVFVSFLLSAPLACYGVQRWLQSFAYQVPLYGWVLIVSLLIVMLLTLITVTVQSWWVATSNPVHSLKNE